jgi:hypothetical protein
MYDSRLTSVRSRLRDYAEGGNLGRVDCCSHYLCSVLQTGRWAASYLEYIVPAPLAENHLLRIPNDSAKRCMYSRRIVKVARDSEMSVALAEVRHMIVIPYLYPY